MEKEKSNELEMETQTHEERKKKEKGQGILVGPESLYILKNGKNLYPLLRIYYTIV